MQKSTVEIINILKAIGANPTVTTDGKTDFIKIKAPVIKGGEK